MASDNEASTTTLARAIRARQSRLENLGEPRTTPEACRAFLLKVAARQQILIADGLRGIYVDEFFAAADRKLRGRLDSLAQAFEYSLAEVAGLEGTLNKETLDWLEHFDGLTNSKTENGKEKTPAAVSTLGKPCCDVALRYLELASTETKTFIEQALESAVGEENSHVANNILSTYVDPFFEALEGEFERAIESFVNGYDAMWDAEPSSLQKDSSRPLHTFADFVKLLLFNSLLDEAVLEIFSATVVMGVTDEVVVRVAQESPELLAQKDMIQGELEQLTAILAGCRYRMERTCRVDSFPDFIIPSRKRAVAEEAPPSTSQTAPHRDTATSSRTTSPESPRIFTPDSSCDEDEPSSAKTPAAKPSRNPIVTSEFASGAFYQEENRPKQGANTSSTASASATVPLWTISRPAPANPPQFGTASKITPTKLTVRSVPASSAFASYSTGSSSGSPFASLGKAAAASSIGSLSAQATANAGSPLRPVATDTSQLPTVDPVPANTARSILDSLVEAAARTPAAINATPATASNFGSSGFCSTPALLAKSAPGSGLTPKTSPEDALARLLCIAEGSGRSETAPTTVTAQPTSTTTPLYYSRGIDLGTYPAVPGTFPAPDLSCVPAESRSTSGVPIPPPSVSLTQTASATAGSSETPAPGGAIGAGTIGTGTTHFNNTTCRP